MPCNFYIAGTIDLEVSNNLKGQIVRVRMRTLKGEGSAVRV
jgi:hypothetical protein